MTKKDSEESAADQFGGGRRQADRRQAEAPYAGPERRKTERRSINDRRTTPRDDGMGEADG